MHCMGWMPISSCSPWPPTSRTLPSSESLSAPLEVGIGRRSRPLAKGLRPRWRRRSRMRTPGVASSTLPALQLKGPRLPHSSGSIFTSYANTLRRNSLHPHRVWTLAVSQEAGRWSGSLTTSSFSASLSEMTSCRICHPSISAAARLTLFVTYTSPSSPRWAAGSATAAPCIWSGYSRFAPNLVAMRMSSCCVLVRVTKGKRIRRRGDPRSCRARLWAEGMRHSCGGLLNMPCRPRESRHTSWQCGTDQRLPARTRIVPLVWLP
mmetsp:Transcript_20028/g.60867  ORF Transcript_20028/g.60867 Transcript_20028/m.60867 type:complete len:264 (+) Transcript_20028:692-1483(+)